MQTIIQSFKQIGLFTTALTLALVANFAYGQWADPTAAPVGGNIAAPINTSGEYQIKGGNIGAFDLIAGNKMRSDLYCDFTGNNCVPFEDLYTLINGSTPPPPPPPPPPSSPSFPSPFSGGCCTCVLAVSVRGKCKRAFVCKPVKRVEVKREEAKTSFSGKFLCS